MNKEETIPLCEPVAGPMATVDMVNRKTRIIEKVIIAFDGETAELSPEMFQAAAFLFNGCEVEKECVVDGKHKVIIRLKEQCIPKETQ